MGRQSITDQKQGTLLTYGDPPVDLNLTASSGLPVSLEILDGNSSVDLNGSKLEIKHPGFVQIRAFQNGNNNWMAAQALLLEFQILPKELIVRPHNQFRRPDEANPEFTYDLIGLADGDQFSDINVTIVDPVLDGNQTNPSPGGIYQIIPQADLTSKYFFSFQNGTLTVSEKFQQNILFDQNLTNIPATTDFIDLTASSVGIEGNLTGLPITYSVEDESVAKILVTKEDHLSGYWKLDETLTVGLRTRWVGTTAPCSI